MNQNDARTEQILTIDGGKEYLLSKPFHQFLPWTTQSSQIQHLFTFVKYKKKVIYFPLYPNLLWEEHIFSPNF